MVVVWGRAISLFETLEDEAAPTAPQILASLQMLQRHQESATEEELYKDFEIGVTVGETVEEDVLTNEVAAAVVDFFHREAAAGRPWESLIIRPLGPMEPFVRILEGAKSSGLFSGCKISSGLSGDHVHQQQILQHFCRGNSSLEDLSLYHHAAALSPATLGALHETLHDVSCGIKHLTLSVGRSPVPVGVPLINALGRGCHSLESLCFARGTVDQDQVYNILKLVNSCPRLQKIELFDTRFIGNSFWSPSLPDECSLDARKRLYRLILPRNLRFNRWDYTDDQEISKLLQAFPALGDFGYLPLFVLEPFGEPFVVVFTLRTTQLLAFNYAGPAQLDHSLRPSGKGSSQWDVASRKRRRVDDSQWDANSTKRRVDASKTSPCVVLSGFRLVFPLEARSHCCDCGSLPCATTFNVSVF